MARKFRLRPALSALALCLALAFPSPHAGAAEPARLIADSLSIASGDQLIASGNVEVFYKGQRLRAQRILYNRATDKLIIEGPIRIDDSATGSVILADAAELDADLRDGLLTSARLVLNQQLQLAAAEMRRVDGRWTSLKSVVASSCKVCASDPTPLWELRAARVVHDQVERQIYFDHAQLRFGGVPVFYLPRLRVPDPSLRRASGFLIPSLRTTSTQGLGIRMPYFWAIAGDKDLTVTPYLTTEGVRSVDLRYRQAFDSGNLTLRGAVSQDRTLGHLRLRGYVEAEGQFRLPHDYRLTLDAEAVTDAGYFRDYGLDERDRLVSRVTIDRIGRDDLRLARLHGFYSLRPSDDNTILPSLAMDATWLRRIGLGAWGEGVLGLQLHGHARYSASVLDSDGDGLSDGRDVLRGSLRGEWRKDWLLGPGILATLAAQSRLDLYGVREDASLSGQTARSSSALAAEFRWPFQRHDSASGISETIEPVAQFVWSHRDSSLVANEDSRLAEFDEGNLFSLSRFSGADVVETGFRANLGLAYARQAPDGQHLRLALGRVYSGLPTTGFSDASGLSTIRSDWIVALGMQNRAGLSLMGRALIGDQGEFTKAQLRLSLQREKFNLSGGYAFAIADAAEGRAVDLSELALTSSVKMNPNWTLLADGRYDLTAQTPTRANLGLRFTNECLQVDLSLSHRFTSSTSVTPTTAFGLSVELLGFGGTGAAGPARACRK